MIRKYLAKPSAKDDRDFAVTMLIPKLEIFPKEFRTSYLGKIKDQGQIGSCVAHSAAYCREMTEYKQSGVSKQFSVGFIYANRLATDLQTEGMVPREMLKALQKYGSVLYDKFPYNESYPVVKKYLTPIKTVLYTDAEPYKISAYAKLDNSDELKSALMQLGPVTICIPVYEAFEELTKSNHIVPTPKKTDKCLGYHENTITGWEVIDGVEYWIDLNSWGSTWGNDGYCNIPFDFPLEEAWSITDNITPQPNVDPSTHIFFKVLSKQYKTKSSAKSLLSKVKLSGYPLAVVNLFNGKYVVQLGAFTENDESLANIAVADINKKLPIGKFVIELE